MHAAILLGTAAELIRHRDWLTGKIVFLFQPAEETPGGADDIVAEHLLSNLGVNKIFAERSAPGVPVGTITISPGPTMAGSSYFALELSGRGSHAAAPFDGDDVVLAAASMAAVLSNSPARRFEIATRPVVVSITKFLADGGASNVLPSHTTLTGTIRAFEDPKTAPDGGSSIEKTLLGLIEGHSKAHNLSYQWDLRTGSPPTINNPELFAATIPALSTSFTGQLDTRLCLPHTVFSVAVLLKKATENVRIASSKIGAINEKLRDLRGFEPSARQSHLSGDVRGRHHPKRRG